MRSGPGWFVLGGALVALGACERGGAAGGRSSSGAAGPDGAVSSSSSGSDGAAEAQVPEDAKAVIDGADSTVILTVTSNDGSPIAEIASLVVTIQQDGNERTVAFAHATAAPITDTGVELSLAVVTPEAGEAIFGVEARTAAGCTAAKGIATVSIAAASTAHAVVALARLDDCAGADAGSSEGGAPDGGGRFPGCDPVSTDCPDGMTCEVSCPTKKAACVAGGSGFHGAACATTADCAPGTQCIDYAPAGCAVKICRHFCDDEANCPQPIALAMPRSVCTEPLSCSGAASPYHTCTVSCDPTSGANANGVTTCADGLACLLVDASHADCTCPARTRTKAEGAACATNDDCAPGLACDVAGATRTCRAVCRCYAENGACGAAGDCPAAGTHCAPLVEGGVFGVCRP
jgi:hypothetical protein